MVSTRGSIPKTPGGCLKAIVGLILFVLIFRWTRANLASNLILALLVTLPVWYAATFVLAILLGWIEAVWAGLRSDPGSGD